MRRILVTVGLLLLVGCSPGGGAATPTTSPESTPSPVPTTTRGTPPPVGTPIDVRPFEGRPCDLLSVEQLDLLRYLDKQGNPSLAAPWSCSWQVNDAAEELVVTQHPDRDVLAEFYADRSDRFPVFGSDTVDGYPIALRQLFEGSGLCFVAVGLGGGQSLEVEYQQIRDPIGDVCANATAGIEQVLTTLRPTG